MLPSTGLKPGSLRAEWREKALCHTESENNPVVASAFTAESRIGLLTVKRICRKCPVRMECLMDALADKHSWGYRNGFFFTNGALSAADNKLLQDTYGVRAKPRQKKRAAKCVDQDV